MKNITILSILLFFLVSCRSENIDDRMKQYESQMDSFTLKANTIQNDSIKQKLYGIAMWLFGNEEDTIRMQREPNSSKYKDNPYFLLESYPTHKDLANNYINGKILYYSSKSETDYTIAVKDAFDVFSGYPFKNNTIWQEVIFDNLKTYPIVPEDIKNDVKSNDIRITESGKLTSPKRFKISYPTDNKKQFPTKVKALVQTEIPSNINQFHFFKTDIGKTQTKNNVSVTLLKMEKSYAEIEITVPDGFFKDYDICDQFNWLKIEAKDQTSKFISMSTASGSLRKKTYNAVAGNLYKELTAQEKFTPEFLSTFLEKANKVIEDERALNETRDKKKQYRFQYFRGAVNEINVDIYDYTKSEMISKEVVYPIFDYNNLISQGNFKEIPTTATVYDNEITALANKPYEIQVDDLKNQITIDQVPALMSKSSIVEFKYPNLISSKIIGEYNRFNKIKEFSFLNKNEKPITISPDSINQGSWEKRGSLINIYNDKIEYFPKRSTETPFYAKGIIEVAIRDIRKQTYGVENLPEGVLVKENAVLLDQKIFRAFKYVIFVKDSTNRYLKRIHEYSGAVDIDGVKLNKHISYYYGKPQTIEIYTIADKKNVDYNFKVKLTREENGKYMHMWN